MEWINCKDRLPEHGQHVLIWEDRFNVFPFPRGHKGDDGKGRIRMGDAVYLSGDAEWEKMTEDYRGNWQNSKEEYKRMNSWDNWSGQGPCSFDNERVTHWCELPKPPKGE